MGAAAWILLAALAEVGGAPPSAGYRLAWTRAPGGEACIDADALAEQVSARLGRRVFDGAGERAVVIDAEVGPGEGGWQVRVTVRGPDGELRGARELAQPGDDCRAIDQPLALVLALIIDLDAASAAPPPAPGSTTTTAIAPPRPRADRWRGEATLVAGAGLGVVPGAGVGARVTLAVDAPGLWPVVVGAAWWREGEASAGGDERVRLRPRQLDAAVCAPGRDVGAARMTGCAGGGLRRIDARGLGFDRNHDVSALVPVAALAARAAVDLPAHAFVAAELGVELPLARPRFVFDDGGTMVLHRVAPASLAGALGVGVRF